jgi:hypothetical protein
MFHDFTSLLLVGEAIINRVNTCSNIFPVAIGATRAVKYTTGKAQSSTTPKLSTNEEASVMRRP